jgi:4,5-dihydroxyphthalate decarboxylase
MRQFHHAPIVYNVKSGVKAPKDLEGKKVGVRAYTVTTGVWARGILASEYGVDLDKVTWVVVDEEHVQEYQKPSNVLERPGANLGKMLAEGELAAAIGAGQVDSPDVKSLIDSPREAEAAWYRKTGIYPINHTVVVKDSLLQADPTLAPRIFGAFKEAKAAFLKQLDSPATLSGDAQALAQRRSIVGDDPLPNGVARNRKALEAIIQFARDQKILPRAVSPEEVFARDTLGLE